MPPSDANPSLAEELRVLHWNIHSWLDPTGAVNFDAVLQLIRESNPDVVSLVEVDETWGKPSLLVELAGRTGYASVFAPIFEYGSASPTGGFGNALLSRLPLQAVIQRQLTWPTTVYNRTEPSEPRAVVLAQLRLPAGGTTYIGSTHLPSKDAAARTAGLQRLRSIANGLAGPWLISGDFNTPASDWLDAADELVLAPDPGISTYPTSKPDIAIDYAIASSGSQARAEVLPVHGSDHLPVLITWQPPATGTVQTTDLLAEMDRALSSE